MTNKISTEGGEKSWSQITTETHRLVLKGELPIVLFSLVLVFSLSCATWNMRISWKLLKAQLERAEIKWQKLKAHNWIYLISIEANKPFRKYHLYFSRRATWLASSPETWSGAHCPRRRCSAWGKREVPWTWWPPPPWPWPGTCTCSRSSPRWQETSGREPRTWVETPSLWRRPSPADQVSDTKPGKLGLETNWQTIGHISLKLQTAGHTSSPSSSGLPSTWTWRRRTPGRSSWYPPTSGIPPECCDWLGWRKSWRRSCPNHPWNPPAPRQPTTEPRIVRKIFQSPSPTFIMFLEEACFLGRLGLFLARCWSWGISGSSVTLSSSSTAFSGPETSDFCMWVRRSARKYGNNIVIPATRQATTRGHSSRNALRDISESLNRSPQYDWLIINLKVTIRSEYKSLRSW